MALQDLIGQTYTIVGSGRWLRTIEHDSLVIDIERQVFFWNSRGIVGDAYKWLTEIIGLSPKEAQNAIHTDKPALYIETYAETPQDTPTPYPALVEVFYNYGKKFHEYWTCVRGYTEETIERFRLGYNGEVYTIPIYVDGDFKNFQCLGVKPKRRFSWYKGLGALPFNFSNLVVTNWVVVTEGPVDAIMLRQNNIPAVSQTGGAGTWKDKWLYYFIETKNIYAVYDNDEAGTEGSVRVAKSLGTGRTKIYNFWNFDEGYDVTDFFKDGGTKDTFFDLLSKESRDVWEVM